MMDGYYRSQAFFFILKHFIIKVIQITNETLREDKVIHSLPCHLTMTTIGNLIVYFYTLVCHLHPQLCSNALVSIFSL